MPNIKATAISATVDQELGKYDALTATFAKTASNVEDFKKVDKVGVEVDGQLELFKITQPEISDTQITIAGVESASDDLAHQSYMLASSNDNLSLSQALQMVFSGTTWTYDLQAEDTTAGIDFSTGTKQEALEQVLDTWQVECYFTYSATTSKITNQVCHIVNKRGIDTHKRLVKGVNVSSFTYSRDLSTIVTGAYATGATPDNENADTSSTDESNTTNQDDTEKQPYTLADSKWSVANGDPMDHDLGNPTLVLQGATNQYGYVDINGNRLPRMITLSYSNDDPQQLIRHVYDYLLIHSQPSLTLTATVYKLQSASLGNRYIAIDREDDIVDASIRAIKIQRNLLNDELSVVTLGNYTIPSASERAKKQEKQTQKAEKTAKEAKEKADKADKETKEAKEKADKANKDLDDYKDSETKRRAAKAKEHAANHEARVKADADRDAKIAQNTKDIDDIKKNSSGSGGTDLSKLSGLITLDFDKDSKTDVETINIHSKDKSDWVIKSDGMFWKSPQQVEDKTDNSKLTVPLIDQEGVLRPPSIDLTGVTATGKIGQIDSNNFGLVISTPDAASGFMVDSSADGFTVTAKSDKAVASVDKNGASVKGNFEIDGQYDSDGTKFDSGSIKITTNSDGDFAFTMSSDITTTTIGKKGVIVDGYSIATQPESSAYSSAAITSGMNSYDDHTDDHLLMTYADVKAIVSRAIYNATQHGTIYEADERLEDNAGGGASTELGNIKSRGSFYKHGSDCLVTINDFYEGGQGDEGSIMTYIMDNVRRLISDSEKAGSD